MSMLVFYYIGMFALLDPARAEVPDAILKARRAQIRVAMVTGDHPTTAAAIGKKVNILSKDISLKNGIDTFKIEHNDETGETIAHLIRDGQTSIGTHSIGELTKSVRALSVRILSNDLSKNKPNILTRIWARLQFYLSDPNQVKDIEKAPLIPYGVIVAGSDIHYMDVSILSIFNRQHSVDLLYSKGLYVGLGFISSRTYFCTNITRTEITNSDGIIQKR